MKKVSLLVCAALLLAGLAGCSGQSAKIESIDDLEGKKIGVQLGTTGDIYATDEFGDENMERYSKGVEAVMALKQGKVDAVIIDNEPAKVFVSQNEDLTILKDPFENEDYAICIAKSNQELTAAFNQAIAALKSDGTLQGILDYYINDAEGAVRYQSPAGADRPNGILKMGTNAEFPPYEYHESGQIVGVDADFARAICDYLGYELIIEDMEFNSIIAAVQTGKVDFGAAAMTVTEDRLQEIDFTQSYCNAVQVIIVKK